MATIYAMKELNLLTVTVISVKTIPSVTMAMNQTTMGISVIFTCPKSTENMQQEMSTMIVTLTTTTNFVTHTAI